MQSIASDQKIIFIHPSDEMYGADRMLLEILAAVPPGLSVEVWLPSDLLHPRVSLCCALEQAGISFRHIDLPIMRRAYRSPTGLFRLVRRCARLHIELRHQRPDIVYCTTSAAFLGAPVARLARVPKIIGHLQEIWSKSDRYALIGLARSCHKLLAISEAVKLSMPASVRRAITVVPNATPEPLECVPLAGRAGPLRFLVASRWNGWKGHRTLLDAWKKAGIAGELVVLGGPPLTGDAVDVSYLVANLPNPGSVKVVGEVEDVGPWIDESDVVIVPSDEPEPFGLIAIEAFARGRPVIGSDGGGLQGIVSDGEDGWLFPPRDSTSLSRILVGLSRTAVTPAGARARMKYESEFTTDRYAATWGAVVVGPDSDCVEAPI